MINQSRRSVESTAPTFLSVLIIIAGISWISDGGYAQSSQDLENKMINVQEGSSNTNLQFGIGLNNIQGGGTVDVCDDDVPQKDSVLNGADSNTNTEGVSNERHTNFQVGVGDCERSSNNKNVVMATNGGIIHFSGKSNENRQSGLGDNNLQSGLGNNNLQAGNDVNADNSNCRDCEIQSNNENTVKADRGGVINIG